MPGISDNVTGVAAATLSADPGDDALLRAAIRVGKASGVLISAPAGGNLSRSRLDGIIDASGARARRVRLAGTWWTSECSPMLAFRKADGEPIAVLPDRRIWLRRPACRVIDREGQSRAVDDEIAASLEPAAYVFYAGLPAQGPRGNVLRFALGPAAHELPAAVTAAVCATALGMLMPLAALIVLERAVPNGDRRLVLTVGAALLAAAAGAIVVELVQAISLLRLVTSTATRVQNAIWDRLLRQPAAFFRRFSTGDLKHRAEAVGQIHTQLHQATTSVLVGTLTALLNAALMLYYAPRLAVAGIAIGAAAASLTALAAYSVQRILRPMQDVDGELTGVTVQLLGAVHKLQTAAAESRAFSRWSGVYRRRLRLERQLQSGNDRVRVAGTIVWPTAMCAILWLAVDSRTAQPLVSVGTFVAFTVAFGAFLTGATIFGDSLATMLNMRTRWDRLGPVLDAEPETHIGKIHPGVLGGQLRLDKVSFRYRDRGPLVLDNVSIRADPGECIAIVGPSGSGKSTIINLLLKFETPLAGTVSYDERDLDTLDALAVRRQLGVVTQENKIGAGSIYDNVACGSRMTLDDAWSALRAAGLDHEIRHLPMALHTLVSEGGGNLSGGQRQRLLIARALAHRPRIVILDEATSALDNRAQEIVTRSLEAMHATRVVVAHRMSTVRHADRIYVIQSGRIVQEGTFHALLEQDGVFTDLMRQQTR